MATLKNDLALHNLTLGDATAHKYGGALAKYDLRRRLRRGGSGHYQNAEFQAVMHLL